MKAGDAIAEILKREGIEIVIGYPVNHILEYAASAGIRPIIVRQERTGLHMADAISRLSSGRTVGVFRCSMDPVRRMPLAGLPRLIASRSLCWSCPADIH